MNKRQLLIAGVLTSEAVAFASAVWLVIFIVNRPDFTEEQFEQLKEGMTREEVAAIMQVPAGDYTLGFGDYRRINGWQTVDASLAREDDGSWCGRSGMICIGFGANERLTWKHYWHTWPPRPEIKKRMMDARPMF